MFPECSLNVSQAHIMNQGMLVLGQASPHRRLRKMHTVNQQGVEGFHYTPVSRVEEMGDATRGNKRGSLSSVCQLGF
jgi:hypothetical protein